MNVLWVTIVPRGPTQYMLKNKEIFGRKTRVIEHKIVRPEKNSEDGKPKYKFTSKTQPVAYWNQRWRLGKRRSGHDQMLVNHLNSSEIGWIRGWGKGEKSLRVKGDGRTLVMNGPKKRHGKGTTIRITARVKCARKRVRELRWALLRKARSC